MSVPAFIRTEILPVTTGAGPTSDHYRLAAEAGPILLDFGRELYGEFVTHVFVVSGPAPARLRVSLGESISEAIIGVLDERMFPVDSVKQLNMDATGFRFACLEVISDGCEVEVVSPRAIAIQRKLERVASFRSGDPQLDAVWEVGARTVELCMQDYLWDGVKRGRCVWAGDLYPAAAVVSTLFREHPIVPASLDHLREQVFDGNTAIGWMNGIPAYTLWWLLVQRDWFCAHRNRVYLESQRGFLRALLPILSAGIDSTGRECLQDGWRFFDWASNDDTDAVHAGYQGLLKLGLEAAAQLCEELREIETANLYRDAANRLMGWEPPERSKQAWALMSLARLVDPDRARVVLTSKRNDGLTPFLGYVVLEALAELGETEAGVELIRQFWGAMINLGATTFWEDFDLAWIPGTTGIDRVVPDGERGIHERFMRCSAIGLSQSLCHAWSAGPTAWLSRHFGVGK